MSIFDSFGEYHTVIEVRTTTATGPGEVEVISGTRDLGVVREVDAGEFGGETGELAYQAFNLGGALCSRTLGGFEGAIASIIERSDLT